MRIRRAHCALAVVLAALTLTGCSDSPAATAPVAKGTQATQPSQPAPTKSDAGPTDDETTQIAKFAAAIQTFNKWLQAHCPNLDLEVEGPAS